MEAAHVDKFPDKSPDDWDDVGKYLGKTCGYHDDVMTYYETTLKRHLDMKEMENK